MIQLKLEVFLASCKQLFEFLYWITVDIVAKSNLMQNLTLSLMKFVRFKVADHSESSPSDIHHLHPSLLFRASDDVRTFYHIVK